jgi:hypothetical protein
MPRVTRVASGTTILDPELTARIMRDVRHDTADGAARDTDTMREDRGRRPCSPIRPDDGRGILASLAATPDAGTFR